MHRTSWSGVSPKQGDQLQGYCRGQCVKPWRSCGAGALTLVGTLGPPFSCLSCQTWKPQTEQMRYAGPVVPKGLAGL